MNTRLAMMIAAVAVLAGAGGYGAYLLGQRSVQHAPAAAADTGRKVLYWQDPMVPGQRFDKPGKSPYMDMDLVPVYADEQPDAGAVRVSPGVQQNLGIRLASVREGALGAELRVAGNVAFNERERVMVQARANGFVERLYSKAPLDPVRQGQALLELYVPDWVAAQEEYLSVKRMGEAHAAGLLDAARQRMRLAGMTDEQIRRVAAQGKVQPRITVTAPAGGVVSELAAREGMTVSMGAPLMTINGLRTVWVNAQVPEGSAAQVRPGTQVEATTPAHPGERFKGRVEALLPQVDPATRTLTARIELANPAHKLTPGMFTTVSLLPAGRKQVLLVPSEAVIQTGTRAVVIVASNGKFQPVEVSVGQESNGETEVLAGLSAGQQVVASGQFLIDSEASLRGAVRRLSEPGQAPAANAPAAHAATGRIEKIEPGEVMISHGPIPGLKWGEMTMGFVPPKSGMPRQLKEGDSISFKVRALPDGRYEIADIQAAAPQAQDHSGHGGSHDGAAPAAPHDHSGAH